MSITLDKFGIFSLPVYSDASDARIPGWCRQWESMEGFDRLDSMRAVESELDRLVDPFREMTENGADLVEKPALKEFELVVSEPIPSVRMSVVRFKKSILPEEAVRHVSPDGHYMEMTPLVDAYMSFRNKDELDSVMTIFNFRAYKPDGEKMFMGTMQKEFWRSSKPEVRMSIARDYDGFMEVMRDIKLVYIGIQRAMYNKPEIFVEPSVHPVVGGGSGKPSAKHTKSKARIVKKIYLNKEQLKIYSAPHRHMTCPCWGVIGHWRNYKSGKRGWIEPYRKGKKRDDPKAYRAKEYVYEEA